MVSPRYPRYTQVTGRLKMTAVEDQLNYVIDPIFDSFFFFFESMTSRSTGLYSLPVELLHELELFALSESLPLVSVHFNDVYKNALPFFHAKYILGRVLESAEPVLSDVYTKALRYPICDLAVLQAIHDLVKDFQWSSSLVQLPRRLFRSLSPPMSGWTDETHPLPLLRYLYHTPDIPAVNTNANEGYALTRAVHAKFLPLVQFLLEHDASPKCHDGLAVKVAIRQKNLDMVKTLIERQGIKPRNGKKRKVGDRMDLNSDMLKIAVLSNAKDVVKYLYREKNVIPDVQTLKKMGSMS
ncbi:hypothetical protein GALMADRAFT_477677 [Galerina marginata CBS 339.88]|uniref:Uncharacterized protein n=1 Tax=Galerina marginata (strain CBS 339.88) TaxID=685588 RepID=A0A067SZH5_GALM3|nr:hypothetical protein GALMADRAFT_477677 [Galerina marginata CBS 339.88]